MLHPLESIYTIGTSSASHTYGNVAAFLKEMLIHYFPQNFFTYVYIDSKIAWKNIHEILGNGDREFKKRHYPFMIITPRFNESDDDVFLANTPLTTNMDNVESGIHRNALFPMILDKEHQTELSYKMNRDRIDFDVEMRLKTLAQQLDVYKNMKNQMIWNRPYIRQAALESMIPRSMIEYIGKLAGIDISQEGGDHNQIPLIMRFLNSHSRLPITYKVRNSTSVDEFFAYYQTNVLLTFSDLRRDTGNKKDMVDDYYPITFRITAEFNLPGLYALIGTHEKKFHGLSFDAMVQTPNNGIDLIPMYTYTNLYDRYATDTMDGYSFYSSTIIQTDEENAGKDDSVSIQELIPPDHMKALDTFVKDGVPPETLFRFRLLENSKEIMTNCETSETNDYDIDWKLEELTIHHSDPMVTYRVIIYANLNMLNSRFADMQDKVKSDMTLR